MTPPAEEIRGLWSRHDAEWRRPSEVVSQWGRGADPRLLRHVTKGAFWETLAAHRITLLVTREYEHLVMALCVTHQGPQVSYLGLPHPSGLVVDRQRGVVHVACTRNPNQVFDLRPVAGLMQRPDVIHEHPADAPLVPLRIRFYPGCLYFHDLALIAGMLHVNSVGQNAVVRLFEDGRHERVWWPRCIESGGRAVFGRNHIQLNSIAAGPDLASSYFSASTDKLSQRRPGHRNFAVDKQGVVFSGATREPVARGLTRPHSARLHGGRVWIDNSGYGELGVADTRAGTFVSVVRLPGWTRGLCFHGRVAFVGTSRVIPRFRQYAPGLEAEDAVCGVHAVDARSGRVLGSLVWPHGNQVFALDWMPGRLSSGFPYLAGRGRGEARERAIFYAFRTRDAKEAAC